MADARGPINAAGRFVYGHPQMVLPILFYNLIQHLAAGAVNAARKQAD